MVLEPLSHEFCAGVPWEDLYADDLVIIADSLEECVRRLLIWKEAMEKKRLRVNAGKTKVMICGTGLDLLQNSGKFLCAVCRTGVGNSSIYCNSCQIWVHKKSSELQQLTPNPDYRCARCMGYARPIEGRPQKEMQVAPGKLEVVSSFCYLGDMLSAGRGCEIAVTTRVKMAWKKFRELLEVLTFSNLSYKTVAMCTAFVCEVLSSMPVKLGHWPRWTCRAYSSMTGPFIRQISGIKPEDVATVRSSQLLAELELEDLTLILREGFAGLGMWSVLVVQSEQCVIYSLMTGGGRKAQANMKETDRERLQWVEAHNS